MRLPFFSVKRILSFPTIIHPNLMDRVKIRGKNLLIKGKHTGPWDLSPQREALRLCFQRALDIWVSGFFEHSNAGFLYAYPTRTGRKTLNFNSKEAPLFSRLCWKPFKREELLFLLRLTEEKRGPAVVSIKGPEGAGKSWLMRRAVSLHHNGLLLDAAHPRFELHLQWALKSGPWDVVALENYNNERAREAFKLLFASFPRALFILEGEETGAYTLELKAPSLEQWKAHLVFLDEEVKEKTLPVAEEHPFPGQLISALMGKRKKEKLPYSPPSFPRLKSKNPYLKEAKVEKALARAGKERALELLKTCRTRACKAIKAFLLNKEFHPKEGDSALAFLWAGKIQERRGNPALAEALLRQAYRKALSDLDGETAGRAFSDLGAFFYRLGNLDQAEEFFSKALTLLSTWGSEKAFTLASYNLAEVLFLKGEWDKAEKLYRLSYEKTPRESLSHAYDATSLGYLLYLKGKHREGKELLREGAEIFLRAGSPRELEDLAWKVSEISVEEGRPLLEGANLPYPYPLVLSFLKGRPAQEQGPWGSLLNGLLQRRRNLLLRAIKEFSLERKDILENFTLYMMAREGLWRSSDLPRLRKSLVWHRRRNCFRAKTLENVLEMKEGEREKLEGEEEEILGKLLSLAKENWGDLPSAFLITHQNMVLNRVLSPPVAWTVVRQGNRRLARNLSEVSDPDQREELFVKGIKSFILESTGLSYGTLVGFVASPEESFFNLQDLERLRDLLRLAARSLQPKKGFLLLKGRSAPMQRIFAEIRRAATERKPVLIVGETGTGKELVARSISLLRGENFVAVNCASIPENLLESELFGYAKGAFTGADRNKPGLIEEAKGGILFLDEIGEMPLEVQAKFLRVLQDGRLRRLGETREREVDFKLVSATNRDLSLEVEKGGFRRDLYHRISHFTIKIPPLRERKEDIIPLAEHFARKYSGKEIKLSRAVKAILLDHRWPGNVRELEATLRFATSLLEEGEEVILPQHLPRNLLKKGEFKTLEEARALWEREYVKTALLSAEGDISKASSLLGISRQHLYNLLRKYDLK